MNCSKPLSQQLINENIFKAQVVACYLHGDIKEPSNTFDHDIDIIFVLDGEISDPESLIDFRLLEKVSSKIDFNIKVNGIDAFKKSDQLPTIDICCDWIEYIKKKDPVSVLDIAKKKYTQVYGDTAYYRELKDITVTTDMIKTRVGISRKYIKRCCNNRTPLLIRVAAKKLMHCICMINNSDFSPSIYLSHLKEGDSLLHYKIYSAYISPDAFKNGSIIDEIISAYDRIV